ncbi:MAG: MFS transporter [Candidatus Marsarchaeota archaeon]|nr:MFS transporter [Candidatus Marsarchaeota archaeon]
MDNLKKIAPYWLLLFTIGFGWFILAPLVPGLIKTFGITLPSAILLISVYGFAMIVLGLLAGWISAKFTVKAALYSAAAITFVGLLGRALSQTYAELLAFQLLAAIAYPLAMAPVGTVSESLFKKKSHTIIGMSVGVLFLGMAAGAMIGPSIFAAFGLSGAFDITVLLSVVALACILRGIKDYPVNYKGKSLKGTFKVGMLRNWYVGAAIAMASVMFGSIASTMLILNKLPFGTAIADAGLFGGLAFLGSAVGAMLLPTLFERYGKIRTGLIATSLLSFIFIFITARYLSFNPIVPLLALSYFLLGMFGNAYWSMAMASTVEYVDDPAKAGFATSMYSVATNIGVAVLPIFLGPLFTTKPHFAIGIVSAIEFVAFLLSFTLFVKVARGRKRG